MYASAVFSANGLSGITLKKDNVLNTQPLKKNAYQNQRLLHNCDFVQQKLLCKNMTVNSSLKHGPFL